MTSPVSTPHRILITGANGFIGVRLCELMSKTYHLSYRAFVRTVQRSGPLAELGAEQYRGDLLDAKPLPAALAGCDAVVHLAHGEDRDGPRATRNLVEACLQAGVTRFVHISSMSVHGPSPTPKDAVEETATIGRYHEAYADSKAEQEEIVREAIDKRGLQAVILRPTVVYGPRSPFVSQIIKEASGGTITTIDGGLGRCNAVFVDDVCDAIVRALSSERAVGQAMFINADQAVTWREFITAFGGLVEPEPKLESIASVEALKYWADRAAAQPAQPGLIAKVLRRITRKLSAPAAPIWPNPGRVARETVQVEFSNRKARELLGWEPRYGFAEGVSATREWMERARLRSSP